MKQTSVHFEPVKSGSEEHNKRLKPLDYVHHELTPNNEYWESDTQSARLSAIKAIVKEKTGRSLQAKATPIREAVVVISADTTMNDLKRLSKAYKDQWGLDVFQISIHRDEGFEKSKDSTKLNLHAHLVVDWTNHQTGKSIKLNRQDMSEIQTITAEILGMQRGISSDRKHLSAIQYKAKAEEERLQTLKDEVKAMNVSKAAKERFLAVLGQSSKDKEIRALRASNEALRASNEALQAESIKVKKTAVQQIAEAKEKGAQGVLNSLNEEFKLIPKSSRLMVNLATISSAIRNIVDKLRIDERILQKFNAKSTSRDNNQQIKRGR